jgi:hypothetical protein
MFMNIWGFKGTIMYIHGYPDYLLDTRVPCKF